MAATKSMTRTQLLREFFFRPGQDTLASFMEEIKQLSADERQELAELVSKYLGVDIKS